MGSQGVPTFVCVVTVPCSDALAAGTDHWTKNIEVNICITIHVNALTQSQLVGTVAFYFSLSIDACHCVLRGR